MAIEISIIGGGPSSVFSYYGALDAGFSPDQIEILVDKFSMPAGAFWLRQSPIPWPQTWVVYNLLGSADGYSEKQWGKVIRTSAHTYFEDGNLPWNQEPAYLAPPLLRTLWSILPTKRTGPLTPEEIEDLKKIRKFVIQTFPKDPRWDPVLFPVYDNSTDNNQTICTYNGDKNCGWIRQTLTVGKVFVEYPSSWLDRKNDILAMETDRWGIGGKIRLNMDLQNDSQPLSWTERSVGNLFLVGKLATGDRKMLAHQAREDVAKFIRENT